MIAPDELFSQTQDSSNPTDDTMIINQLLEYPEILSVLNDPNFSLPNLDQGMDLNYPDFNYFAQDFSQQTDIQFNMLVNENQKS